MLTTRNEVKDYAVKICLAMLEQTAERYAQRIPPIVIDELGYVPTFLEEFCRPLWGLAPVLRDTPLTMNVLGEQLDVATWLRQVLIEGTDPASPRSWDTYREDIGNHRFAFQNLTELAGWLIGMYFAREALWEPIPQDKKDQIAQWIYACCECECEQMAGNNHIWFPLFNLLVLKKFGYVYPNTDRWLQEGMEKLDGMYVAQGWYQDGDFGRFDYYTAWSMHSYPLIWCLIEDESFPGYQTWRDKYVARTEQFLPHYLHWFDVNGAHAPFGRSLAYRFAASCVFPLAVLCGCKIDPRLAGRATLKNISYFQENALLNERGVLPAGYLYESPALVEFYTSDGGAYWCAKTFLCLLMPEDHPFWQIDEVRLPIEEGNFLVAPAVDRIRMKVGGTTHSGVTIYNNVFQYYQRGVYWNPFNDMAGYYDKFAYNSRAGFALSTRDRTSYDSMIGVMTKDQSMHSHRWGFIDLGEKEGAMLSRHTPFSNDPGTVMTTALFPLMEGWHVRLHHVRLSQPYLVREGGFCVGQWDDCCKVSIRENECQVAGHNLVSVMAAVGSAPFEMSKQHPQPGMHLLAPHAAYPCYTTEELAPGEYVFACVCGVFDVGHIPQRPELQLTADRLIVSTVEGAKKLMLHWLNDGEVAHG